MTKKIEAYIRTEKFDDVKSALLDIGIVGMSVLEVRGRGRGAGMLIHGRTGDYIIDLMPRILITIILSDRNVNATIEAIRKASFTGEKGDGVIVVSPIEDVIRISTDERNGDALQYQGDIDTRNK
jgi:nitrogen regulatory protein PII